MKFQIFLFVIAVIGLVETFPINMGLCSDELRHAHSCARVHLPHIIHEVMPLHEVEKVELQVGDFMQCLGEIECVRLKRSLEVSYVTFELVKNLSPLYNCLTNDRFKQARHFCSPDDCDEKFVKCLAKTLAKENECTELDIEKLVSLSPLFKKKCEKKTQYEKKYPS